MSLGHTLNKYAVSIILAVIVSTMSWQLYHIAVNTHRLDQIEQRHRQEDRTAAFNNCLRIEQIKDASRALIDLALHDLKPDTPAYNDALAFKLTKLAPVNCVAPTVANDQP